MTKKEAIEILEILKRKSDFTLITYPDVVALNMAIKSLENEEETYKRGYEQGQKDILEEMRLGKERWIFNNGTECRMITDGKVVTEINLHKNK